MKRKKGLWILVLAAATAASAWAAEAASAAGKRQEKCPVMGGPINTNLFVDAEGLRIYVCCAGCTNAIQKAPKKYIEKMKEEGVTPAPAPAKAKEAAR